VLIQIVGSLLVLAGFVLAQLGVLNSRSLAYLLMNAVGSGALAVEAFLGRQWGFLLLEGVWAIVSVVSMARLLQRR
jgi:membrane-bound ClpP family serine protease